MYAQPRPDWTGYGQHGGPPLTPGHPVYGQQSSSAPAQQRNQAPSRDISMGRRPSWHCAPAPRDPSVVARGRPASGPSSHRTARHPALAARARASSTDADAGADMSPFQQVYSFVPIPGAQQHKRPRRRYEEIERMYKCGYNGCEKAYGTLNHLNAHVTMQSHGPKRTPEEFKEIRKEWKQRKKEEEAQRKAEEARQRQQQAAAAAQNGGADPQGPDGTPASSYGNARAVQLPPIGYSPTQYPAPPPGMPQPHMAEYSTNHMYSNYQPHSPYGQPSQNIYSHSNGGQPPSH
ncbi:hypothetical protein RJ55_07611 [Drechmeria coniospora]|nr:hypothetical protein RJ55_07611 [Drechmeria coniospora]